jgi:hypothetical protein
MFMGSSGECCLHATLSSPAAGCGAVLLVGATILFVVGTTIERSQARTGEDQEATTLEQSAGEHNEQAEATQKVRPTPPRAPRSTATPANRVRNCSGSTPSRPA